MQHSESSTGVLHDVQGVAAVTRPTDAILIVDAVSSLGIARSADGRVGRRRGRGRLAEGPDAAARPVASAPSPSKAWAHTQDLAAAQVLLRHRGRAQGGEPERGALHARGVHRRRAARGPPHARGGGPRPTCSCGTSAWRAPRARAWRRSGSSSSRRRARAPPSPRSVAPAGVDSEAVLAAYSADAQHHHRGRAGRDEGPASSAWATWATSATSTC